MTQRIRSFCFLPVITLTILLNFTIAHPWPLSDNSHPWLLEEQLFCDFGLNGSFYVGFRGWCPVFWNTSSPVPLEYGLNFQDDAEFHPIHLTLFFRVKFFNEFSNPTFSSQKIVFSFSSTTKQFFDAFRTPLYWNLSVSETSISSGDSWDGRIVMNATIGFDTLTFTKESNPFKVTYKYTSPHSNGLFIPLNVLFGGAFLGVIVIIIFMQIRRRCIE